MCGIAAIIDPIQNPYGKSDHVADLFRMLEIQEKRGPDESGIYHRNSVFLGHGLLRVIDCDESVQPLSSINAALIIVFNGEIYNFRELRSELLNEGVRFRTQGDAEVIMELYRLYGAESFERLRGMFACVLHDQARREVIVARDRYGQKPLYCAMSGRKWSFASSLRAVQSQVRSAVDEDSLKSYLWTLMPQGDRTMLRSINLVAPGKYLRISEAGVLLEEGKFGGTACRVSSSSLEEAGEAFQSLLDCAVQEQTFGLKSVSTHISGGLDSGAIAVALKRIPGVQIKSFSCSYQVGDGSIREDERGFEELHYARKIAQKLNVNSQTVRVSPDDYLFDIVDLVQALEEPRGNPCMPHFQLCRVIAEHDRVILSGEGADELFGGYHWKINAAKGTNNTARFFASLLPAPVEIMRSALSDQLREHDDIYSYVAERTEASSAEDRLRNYLKYDRDHFLQYLLLQADKLAGYFSVEGRYPFLDNRIVQLAESLPLDMLLVGADNAKPVIRHAVMGHLPDEVLNRHKMGFVAPEGGWYGRELFGLVNRVLLHKESYISSLFAPEALVRILNLHQAGKHNFRKLIWALLMLEIWHKTAIEGVSTTDYARRIQTLRFHTRNRIADGWDNEPADTLTGRIAH